MYYFFYWVSFLQFEKETKKAMCAVCVLVLRSVLCYCTVYCIIQALYDNG